MSMKRFLAALFCSILVFSMACGGGEKSSKKDDGEDDGEEQTATVASTAGTAAAAAAPAAVAADAANIAGSVKLDGAAPKMPSIQMSADPYCQAQHPAPVADEDVVVSPTGQLANVFVYVKDISGTFPVPTTDALIDQKGCQYHPHVQGIQVGQTLDIRNSDATLHNIHAMPTVNSQFNEGQPVQGMISKKKFEKVEMTPFKMKCDVHGWMHSYMAVMPHPFYAVSAADGTFSIPNLPPGQYTLVAWHEKYGSQEQKITVGAKEAKTVAFTFKG